jgi:hypothetical protein
VIFVIDTKNKLKKVAKFNEELFIKKSLLKKAPQYLKEFNETCELLRKAEETQDFVKREEYGKKIAVLIAKNFDFDNEIIKEKKREYVEFSREILYELSSKPYNNPETMIILIQALYGQTNIAYSHIGEHKAVNIEDGNAWVDYLEKQTKNRTLKSYALALRSYQYIVNGEIIGMSVKNRVNKSEKDLIYATKWDEENYLAYICLGLIYMDKESTKYDLDKSIKNFNAALAFKNKNVFLDNYLNKEEKARFMENAKKKVKQLESL